MYTDPSGNIFGLIWLVNKVIKSTDHGVSGVKGTIKEAQGIWNWTFNGSNMSKMDPTINYKQLINSYKIDVGELMTAPWEKPQAMLGNLVSHTRNLSGNVDNVEIRNGVVLVNDNDPSSRRRWGMTLGPYIDSENIEVGDDMYWHELGHTIQSRILGPLYITKVGIPSLMSATFGSDEYHSNSWYEVWANRLGGVPESNEYPRDYRRNNFWYWWWITTLPIYPN